MVKEARMHPVRCGRSFNWLVLPLLLVVARPAAAADPTHVLVLYSDSKSFPANVDFERGLLTALQATDGGTVEYYPEYLESGRFPGEGQSLALRDYLRRKHADHKVNVVLAMSAVSLDFVLRFRRDLFADAGLVFHTITSPTLERTAAAGATGVIMDRAYRNTIAVALQLQPETKHVFVVSGTAERDGRLEKEVRQELQDFRGRVDLTYLTDLPIEQLVGKLSDLPPQSVIFYVEQSLEEPGRLLNPAQVLSRLAQRANAPIYGLSSRFIGVGAVGGFVMSAEAAGLKSGEAVLQIARGVVPAAIPVAEVPSIPMFDWRELQRWKIAEARVPEASVVRFRNPGVWGSYKTYVVAAVAVFAMQMVLIGALLVQRTSRRQSEAALRRNEARTSAILRMVPDLMFVLSRDGVYLDYHARDPKDLFVPPDGFLGKRMRDVMPPDLAEPFERLLRQALTSEEPVAVEYTLPMAGVDRHFEARLLRCDNETIMSIVRDVTSRRQAEEDLHKAQAELAQAARIRTLGELAAGIAHEVSQPISAIITNARAGLRRLDAHPDDLSHLRDVLRDVVSDGKRASDVITRIRGLVKQTPLQRAPIRINDVIGDVIALSGRLLRQRHVTLHLDLAHDLPQVVADRVQLQQVLLNLVLNAADAMEIMNGRPRLLAIRSARSDGYVTVRVRDSGCGLSDASLPCIFTPFYTTKPEGMGVGLSISRSIVEAHGGHLNLVNNSSLGATFEFELPAEVSSRQTTGIRSADDAGAC
jgi:PAS domain S-box-containing protein